MTKRDAPFHEALKGSDAAIERGGTIYQQWHCQKCGERQTMPDPNVFYAGGECEACGHVTDLQQNGCGYMVMFGAPEVQEIARKALRQRGTS